MKRHLTICLAVLSGMTGALTLGADEDLTDLSLEDLVDVKVEIASLFKESPLTAGSTVTSIEESGWNLMGTRRTLDALDHLPGTYIIQTLGGAKAIATRGFGLVPFMRGDAVLLDGVPLNSPVSSSSQYFNSSVPLGLLSSMEMIRGPGSSLYGSDAFHSVVGMKTWNPDQDVEQWRVAAGSFHYTRAMARVSRGLPGGWRLSMAGEKSHQNNAHVGYTYTDARSLDQTARYQNDFQSQGGLARIRRDRFDFMYLEHDVRNRGFSGIGTTTLFRAGSQSNGEGRFRLGRVGYSHDLSNTHELNVTGYYWHQNSDLHLGSNAGYPTNLFQQQFDVVRYGTDVQIKKPAVDSDLQWVGGFSFSHATVIDAQRKLDGLLPQREEAYRGDVHTVRSVYFSGDLGLDERRRFRALFGARADFYSHYGSEVSPRLGLVHHPTEDSAIKLLYGNAFRAPSAVERKGSLVVQENRGISPESVDTYELVFMKQGRRFHSTTTVYKSTVENLVELVPTAPAVAATGLTHRHQNSGGGQSCGVEQEFKFKHNRFTYEASASHQRAKITRPATTYFTAFPKWIGNAGIRYEVPGDLVVQLKGRWMQGWHEGAYANTPHLTSYRRVDLGARKRISDWGPSTWIEASVKNLTGRNNVQSSVISVFGGLPDERIRATIGLFSEF